jgi:hypothetical protein
MAALQTASARETGRFENGEHFLLGGRPATWGQGPEIPPAYFYKKRYTWDGDPEFIGCAIGCSFCYYRWIDSTSDTIGTGKKGLRRIGRPEGAAEFLEKSKLFRPDRDIVLLCARSDGSMQVDSCTAFLRAFTYNTPIFFLHRGYFGSRQLEGWGADPRAIFSTTLTPMGPDLDWTPIRVEKQVEGIQFLREHGVPAKRISIMLGPLNKNNYEGGLELIRQFADLGIEFMTYRGCSVGNFGVAPNNEQLREIGFLDGDQDERSSPGGHEYYRMKNWLAKEVEEAVLETGSKCGIRLYRFTGTLYEREFGRVVARNRNNRWRRDLGQWSRIDTEKFEAFLRWLGFHPLSIRETEEGYWVELPETEVATEDVAMTVGAEFRTSVLFNRHRIAPTLGDLRFYAQNRLFWPLPDGWEAVVEESGK